MSPPPVSRETSALDAHGDAHAAADAQRRQALLGIAPLHLVQKCHQHARTRGADRMAEGNGAAVHVDLGGIPAEVLVDGAGLGGERLVGFHQVEIVDLPAALLEPAAQGRNRPRANDGGTTAAMRQETMRAIGVLPSLAASLAFISTTAAAPSLMPEALAAVTVPSLSK